MGLRPQKRILMNKVMDISVCDQRLYDKFDWARRITYKIAQQEGVLSMYKHQFLFNNDITDPVGESWVQIKRKLIQIMDFIWIINHGILMN